MGFGSFFKKIINPLTPFKAIGSTGKNLLQGDFKNALLNSTVGGATMGLGPTFASRSGGGGGIRQPSQEAMDYFGSLGSADQQNIMAGFGGRPDLQAWYENARAAGAVPGLNNLAASAMPQVDTSMFGTGSQIGRVAPIASQAALQQLFGELPMKAPAQPMGAGPAGGAVAGSPALAQLMTGLTKLPTLDINAEYERIKAEQGAGAAREWMKQQQG